MLQNYGIGVILKDKMAEKSMYYVRWFDVSTAVLQNLLYCHTH